MSSKHEFEFVTNKTANFKAFINVLKYRAPHIHLDYEIGLVLYGDITISMDDKEYRLESGDIMCMNPCQIHEFKSSSQATLLLIQVNPSYFSNIYPLLRGYDFTTPFAKADADNPVYKELKDSMIRFAELFMEKKSHYELKCSGILNLMFSSLIDYVPHTQSSASARQSASNKAARIRRIADYIDNNYSEKIRLSDLAQIENITVTHMSHFFTDNFLMTFQEYLTKLRCEKARSLLLTTDLSLLDISISCGFSDPKYLNSGFQKQYGCLPKNYRQRFGHENLSVQQASMLTTQQILSDSTSLILLDKYK